MSFRPAILLVLATAAMSGQGDLAVVGAAGGTFGEDSANSAAGGVGISAGWPHSSGHRIQFDYLYTSTGRNLRDHFVTASYVRQKASGRARPFFQAGAGVLVVTRKAVTIGGVTYDPPTDSSLAITFGGGATIDFDSGFFLRPELRVYGFVGPGLSLLPSIAAGWRF